MCDTCGCLNHTGHSHDHSKTVDVHASLFATNKAMAQTNQQLFSDLGLVAINLISGPGSGKTTLLEHTIDALKGEINIGVIEGDIETERDAERIRAKGVPVIQLTTGGACHLDAAMTHNGFNRLMEEPGGTELDLLFIENVGNLVCPAAFDLGEHERVVLVSIPEGPDKPSKYPTAFINSQTFVVSKTDLLPYFDFHVPEAVADALRLNPELRIMEISATTGQGMETWLSYLQELIAGMQAKGQ